MSERSDSTLLALVRRVTPISPLNDWLRDYGDDVRAAWAACAHTAWQFEMANALGISPTLQVDAALDCLNWALAQISVRESSSAMETVRATAHRELVLTRDQLQELRNQLWSEVGHPARAWVEVLLVASGAVKQDGNRLVVASRPPDTHALSTFAGALPRWTSNQLWVSQSDRPGHPRLWDWSWARGECAAVVRTRIPADVVVSAFSAAAAALE